MGSQVSAPPRTPAQEGKVTSVEAPARGALSSLRARWGFSQRGGCREGAVTVLSGNGKRPGRMVPAGQGEGQASPGQGMMGEHAYPSRTPLGKTADKRLHTAGDTIGDGTGDSSWAIWV